MLGVAFGTATAPSDERNYLRKNSMDSTRVTPRAARAFPVFCRRLAAYPLHWLGDRSMRLALHLHAFAWACADRDLKRRFEAIHLRRALDL